jgi:Flp pilus assembly protein TadG
MSKERQMPTKRTQVWNNLCRLFVATRDGETGLAAIEFALIGPILAIGIIGTVDLGLGIYRKMQVQTAAQAGAEYAAAHGFAPSEVTAAIRSATSLSTIQAEPVPVQFCGCATAEGVVSTSCGTTCSGGAAAGTYVSAAALSSYTTIIPYPLFPRQFEFAAQSTVRIR